MSWFSRLFKKEPPAPAEPEAAARLDFVRTFPHVIWVSSVTYDSEAPDGYCYKMFATRHEPEMIIELLLLREKTDGARRTVFHMQAPLDKFAVTDQVVQQLERDNNVVFERFDLSDVRTFDEFQSRALAAGWEARMAE